MKPSEALIEVLRFRDLNPCFHPGFVQDYQKALDNFDQAVREYALDSLGLRIETRREDYTTNVEIKLLSQANSNWCSKEDIVLASDSFDIYKE